MSDIKHPCVYEDASVSLYLEEHPYYGVLIHVISRQWNNSIFKRYAKIFSALREEMKERGYDYIYAAIKPADNKLKKFAHIFCFSGTGTLVKDDQDCTREIFKCLT